MDSVLAGILGVAMYPDVIVVHGPSITSHDEWLLKVLTPLSNNNLTQNAEKCVFGASTIEFVGFHLSTDGICPLQSNINTIHRIPEPTFEAQVTSFMGMTANSLQFLPQYFTTTAPLRQLFRKDRPWAWTSAWTEAVLRWQVRCLLPPWELCCDSFRTVWKNQWRSPPGPSTPPTSATQLVNLKHSFVSGLANFGTYTHIAAHSNCGPTTRPSLPSSQLHSHRPLRLHRWADRLRQ